APANWAGSGIPRKVPNASRKMRSASPRCCSPSDSIRTGEGEIGRVAIIRPAQQLFMLLQRRDLRILQFGRPALERISYYDASVHCRTSNKLISVPIEWHLPKPTLRCAQDGARTLPS